MNERQEKRIYYIFIVIVYILIFQNLLQNYIGFLRYFDEILAVCAVPFITCAFLKRNPKIVKTKDLIIFLMLIIIGIVGIYSNIKYKYQPINIVLSDMIVFYKFFLVYYLFRIFNKNKIIDKYSKKILRHIKRIIIFFFVLTIANYIFHLFPSDYRYGIMVNRLFYEQPTNLVATSVFLMGALIYFEKKINIKYILPLIIVLVSTLRMKAFIFVVVFLIIFLYVGIFNKKINFSKIIIIIVLCLILAFDQIQYYFLGADDIARTVLLNTSIEIAGKYFPIGTGFATFGSHFSAISYSPVYTIYNIQNIHGLSRNSSFYISDSFWPMVLGQFGYIGFFAFSSIIFILFLKLQKQFSIKNKYIYIAKLSVLFYLVISSTSESAFVNPMSILLALILGI